MQNRNLHAQVRDGGPIVLANVSVRLLGAVDTAGMGHLPAPYCIGAAAIGALLRWPYPKMLRSL